jgi:hypothetical protein
LTGSGVARAICEQKNGFQDAPPRGGLMITLTVV